MNRTANAPRDRISGLAPRANQVVIRKSLPRYRATRIDRFLLMAMIIILAFEVYFPYVAGFTVSFIMFMIYGGYLLLTRFSTLTRISFDPLFVTAYILLALGSLIEFFHPYASYSEIFRIGQMIAGAIIVASLCRDRSALRAAMYAYLIAGLWIAVYFFLTSFSALSGATATDFAEASGVRGEVLGASRFHANWAPLILANGAVVALALTLTSHTPYRRYLFLGIAVFCAIASSLPLSRSGILIMIVSLTAVVFTSGVWRGRTILIAGVIAAAIVMWVPNVMWSRLTFSTETHRGYTEARGRIYTAAVEHFPEYAMTGVGAGNFWGGWGRHSNFAYHHGVLGAHNVFIQVTIYWGLVGLLALIAVVWQAYRCLPQHCGSDALSLQLLGVSVAVLIWALSMHNLYAKDFSLVLGLLVGARRQIWPKGIVHPATRKRKLPRPH
jgi:O-Antigen ligase